MRQSPRYCKIAKTKPNPAELTGPMTKARGSVQGDTLSTSRGFYFIFIALL